MVSHIDDETPDPVLDERVRSVLDALAAPTEPGPLPGELDAVAAFRAQHRTRRNPMSHVTPFRMAVASAVGAGVFLTGGVAAAVTGSLPGAAQQAAHDALLAVGIEVPAGERADDRADVRGPGEGSADEVEADVTPVAAVDDVTPAEERANVAAQFGLDIADFARTTDEEGRAKGEAVSSMATGGKGADPQGPPESLPRGGTGEAPAGPETGDDRSTDGKAKAPSTPTDGDDGAEQPTVPESGTDKADEVSGDHSSAGTDNGGRP